MFNSASVVGLGPTILAEPIFVDRRVNQAWTSAARRATNKFVRKFLSFHIGRRAKGWREHRISTFRQVSVVRLQPYACTQDFRRGLGGRKASEFWTVEDSSVSIHWAQLPAYNSAMNAVIATCHATLRSVVKVGAYFDVSAGRLDLPVSAESPPKGKFLDMPFHQQTQISKLQIFRHVRSLLNRVL